MIILGIDPGITITNPTGVAVVEIAANGLRLLDSGLVQPASDRTDWQTRVQGAATGTEQYIALHQPDLIACEFAYIEENPQTALKLAGLCGAVLHLAVQYHTPILLLQPVQGKQALTGWHRASKAEMQRWFRVVFGRRSCSHIADAAGIALAADGQWRQSQMERMAG
jgi:crossover junction endodeoxyribonuclease RuvC